MLKLTMQKDSIQLNINLKESFTLKDRIKLMGNLCQLLEQEGALVESDKVTLIKLSNPEATKPAELTEEPEAYILCTFDQTKNPLGSERCSKCHGSLKLVGTEVRP